MPDNAISPYKVVGSRVAYDNPWIRLDEYDILKPNGAPGIYGVVHFKNLAIGVLVLDENNNTWIVGQHRFPLNQYSWEIPEGGGSKAVAPIESAKRELLEETGIVASEWQELCTFNTTNSASDELAMIFVARGLTFEASQPEDTEILEVKKIPFAELHQMVLKGEIKDSLTIIAVMMAKEKLRL